MSPRDDLIADWRKRLADAAEVSSEATSRPAWLTRLRLRLYRFLLSLYEHGDWNAPAASAASPHKTTGRQSDSATVNLADHSILSGKPAKSIDVIRHTLTAIATAQPPLCERGALTRDSISDGWIVVAASSAHIRTDRLERLLQQAEIDTRISHRGNDRLVEVRADSRDRAFAILSDHQRELHGREKQGQFDGLNFLLGLIAVTTLYAPIAALFLIWPLLQAMNHGEILGSTARGITVLFFLGWAACIIFYCWYGTWRRRAV